MSKEDFFAVGKPKEPKIDICLEETKNWKDIKPQQQTDALNKNMFKKRKFDAFRDKQAKFAAMPV